MFRNLFNIQTFFKKQILFFCVHWSTNAMGHKQSKCCPKGVTLTLHGTRCIHTSMKFRKMKFILYLYFVFKSLLFIICEILIWILQISGEEKL